MYRSEAAIVLGQSRLFGGVHPEDLEDLAERLVERTYRRGQAVFLEGEAGDSLFLVLRGLVKVFVSSSDGREMVLTTLGPAETFGELAVIDGGVRSASVQAVEPTSLLVLDRAGMLAALRDHPPLMEGLLTSLGAVIRRCMDDVADLAFLNLQPDRQATSRPTRGARSSPSRDRVYGRKAL